jgi:glycosyltransferase involved in cell wall biosynthesis
MARQQPAVGAIQACLLQEGVEYAFTYDEGYWPLQAAYRAHVPGAHFFQTLTDVRRFARYPGYIWLLRRRTVVATSRFMQEQIKAHLGLESTLWYPFVDVAAYRSQRSGERTGRIGFSATMGTKGAEIVAEVAACMPERRFLVVGHYHEQPMENVTSWGYITDMRRFYGEIDLLLVPSTWEEPYGRVIIEAAVNGIPSIANRRGGIPEALGDSGLLIDLEPDIAAMAEKYVAAIRLLDDQSRYREYQQKALARAKAYERQQLEMSHQFRERYIG